MEKNFNFDDMRSYRDDEIKDAIERVIEVPELQSVVRFLFPNEDVKNVMERLSKIDTVYAFQHVIIAPLILSICDRSKSKVLFNGVENIKKEKKHLYISNHRDIIMDAGILNTYLDKYGFDTTEIAIGDNLCANQWITDCLKMNKCFLVKRSGTKRELFDAFVKLSAYIRRNITELHNSVWIAQREGRTKDSNDETQESLLKMLSISTEGSMKKGFVDLNIIPVSISYEYDSCDYLKAKEFQQKRDDPNYVKTKDDDILNMKVGMLGYKGRIAYVITTEINDLIEEEVSEEDNRPTVLNKIAKIIDHRVHENYHVFPLNYVALDNLRHTADYLGIKYTADDKKNFESYVEKQIEKIDLPNKDVPFLQEKFWLMYANPLINYLKAHNEM